MAGTTASGSARVHSEGTCGRQQAVVRRAQDILTQRFGGEITLPELAEQLDLTPGYLSALMKKYTGKTFSEYLTYLRIEAG